MYKTLTKKKFLAKIDEAISKNKGIELWIYNPELVDYEIIFNSRNDVEAKREYIDEAYDYEMCLKANPDIEIANIRLVD